MGRILALDYGRRRVGVAVSDPLGVTAQPVDTWKGLVWKEIFDRVIALVERMGVERIIVGIPLTLKGDKRQMAHEVERFAAGLKRVIQVPIELWDERYTSVQAQKSLRKMGRKPGREKEKIDQIASMLVLQNYLEHRSGSSLKRPEEEG